MLANFWLYAFSVTFCKFNGYTKEGKDKSDRAICGGRGNSVGVWIFLFHPLPPSQWGYQKTGKVWGRERQAKEIIWSVLGSCILSVATSHQALVVPCSSHSQGRAASGTWPWAVLPSRKVGRAGDSLPQHLGSKLEGHLPLPTSGGVVSAQE